jgi:hypothetical protein
MFGQELLNNITVGQRWNSNHYGESSYVPWIHFSHEAQTVTECYRLPHKKQSLLYQNSKEWVADPLVTDI